MPKFVTTSAVQALADKIGDKAKAEFKDKACFVQLAWPVDPAQASEITLSTNLDTREPRTRALLINVLGQAIEGLEKGGR